MAKPNAGSLATAKPKKGKGKQQDPHEAKKKRKEGEKEKKRKERKMKMHRLININEAVQKVFRAGTYKVLPDFEVRQSRKSGAKQVVVDKLFTLTIMAPNTDYNSTLTWKGSDTEEDFIGSIPRTLEKIVKKIKVPKFYFQDLPPKRKVQDEAPPNAAEGAKAGGSLGQKVEKKAAQTKHEEPQAKTPNAKSSTLQALPEKAGDKDAKVDGKVKVDSPEPQGAQTPESEPDDVIVEEVPLDDSDNDDDQEDDANSDDSDNDTETDKGASAGSGST